MIEIPGINQEALDAAMKSISPKATEAVMKFVAKKATGKTVYKSKSVKMVQELTNWLNEHNGKIDVVAILPDFNSLSYYVIYEEAE